MKQRKLNAMTQAKLLRLLWEGGFDCDELAEESGLHVLTVYEYCRELHREGMVHIVGWAIDSRGRASKRIFKLGPGRDVPRRALSQRERQARCRSRKAEAQALQVLAGRGRFEQVGNGRLKFIPT